MLALLADSLRWPLWASVSCLGLLAGLLLLHIGEKIFVAQRVAQKPSDLDPQAAADDKNEAFTSFRRQYFVVYGLVMFADWLQGTHMYSLYESYGLNVGALFLTGFLSSVIFGNFVGPLVDKFGRRKACLVYCALEIIINVLENVPHMEILLFGRVLGGISTSLLFSAFESWMVTEHRARGFEEGQLAKTFATGSEINGVAAVIAGLVAQIAADAVGDIGPFWAAVAVTMIAAAFVFSWPENYGSPSEKVNTNGCRGKRANPYKLAAPAYALGLCYSLFEGAMYVFVFLWYPTLEVVVPGGILPGGLVFSSFMLSISIGGKLFDVIGNSIIREDVLLVLVTAASAFSLFVPTATTNYQAIMASFLAFEICVGMLSPCCATLRSRYFPEAQLSTTLSLFRLPTNVLVVLGTGGASYLTNEQLFYGCSTVLVVATACAVKLVQASSTRATPTSKLKAQ